MNDRYEMDRFSSVAVGQFVLMLIGVVAVAVLVGIFMWQHPDKDLPGWAVAIIAPIIPALVTEWRNVVHAVASQDQTIPKEQSND